MHANAKLQYIPIRDRQRFGTTSGLRYFTKIRTDNDQTTINAHHFYEGKLIASLHSLLRSARRGKLLFC